jgi:hypothetical protein
MFKILLCTFTLLSGICVAKNIDTSCAPLVLNAKNESGLPRNFRSVSDDFKKNPMDHFPTREGLNDLHISGSSQFTEKSLESILQKLNYPKNFYDIDLRQEPHGFVNDLAVNFYGARNSINAGKNLNQILREEKELFSNLANQKNVVLGSMIGKDPLGITPPQIDGFPTTVTSCQIEETLVAKFNLNYVRFPVSDALRPADEIVDQFVSFISSLPKNFWLHFHCSAGRGRTAAFMVMYDSMKNAKKVSFEDIVNRQHLLGGADLSHFGSKSSWKYAYAVERYQFLRDFYEYCKSNKDDYATTWSSFIKKYQVARK